MQRSFAVNRSIKKKIEDADKKPTAVADRAGIKRDIFSRILNCKRPVYADELVPIARALGVEVGELFSEQAARG